MPSHPYGRRLRELMQKDGMIVAPGAYDGITANFIKAAGHNVVYMTGSGTSASLGYPDYGLATMTEMVANASRIYAGTTVTIVLIRIMIKTQTLLFEHDNQAKE